MEDNIYTANYIIHQNGDIESLFSHKPLKAYKTKNGYLQVTLYSNDGRHKKFLVHRLVASKHIPNPNGLPQVNHRNMDKTDNRVDNLEWCDVTYNLRHTRKYGRNIYTEERNRKISQSKKGIPCPRQVRKKISATLKGRMSGEKNPMFGKHLTQEQIQKRTHSRFHKSGPVKGCPFC